MKTGSVRDTETKKSTPAPDGAAPVAPAASVGDLHRSLFNRMMDGVYVSTHEGRFVDVNPAMVKMFGFADKEEMLGVDIKSELYFAPSDRDSRFLDSGTEKIEIFRMRRKDGSEIWVEDHGSYIHDEQGRVIFHEGIIRDVTERVLLEERIRKISALKEQLLHSGRLREKMKLITDGIVDIFAMDFARIWIMNPGDACSGNCIHADPPGGSGICPDHTACLHLISSSGRYTHIDGGHRRVPLGCFKIGRVASGELNNFVSNDVGTDPQVHDREWAKSIGLVSFAGYRLVDEEGAPIGVMALFGKQTIIPENQTLLEDLANTVSQVIMTESAIEAMRESEDRYRTLFEACKDVIFINTPEGKILDINPAGVRLFGYSSKEDMMHHTVTSEGYWNPDDHRRYVRELAQHGFLKDYQVELRLPDGSKLVTEETVTAIYGENGEIVAFQGILRDITARKKAEEKLMEKETRYRTLFENANEAIFLMDERQFIECNSNTLNMFGCERDQIIGETPMRFSPPRQPDGRDSGEAALRVIRLALAGEAQQFEWLHQRYDGTQFDAEVRLNRINIGGHVFLQALVRDITARKQAEEGMRKSNAELQKALAEVKTLGGLIPICATCKNIRDDKGYWSQLEAYMQEHTDAQFTHGICPDCAKKFYKTMLGPNAPESR